jgi:hypothetical protein
MDEPDEFLVTTDLAWLRDNRNEADALFEHLTRAGVSGTLAELARHLRAIKEGSWRTGAFRLPCPASEQVARVEAYLVEHERVNTSDAVRVLIAAVLRDIQKCEQKAAR